MAELCPSYPDAFRVCWELAPLGCEGTDRHTPPCDLDLNLEEGTGRKTCLVFLGCQPEPAVIREEMRASWLRRPGSRNGAFAPFADLSADGGGGGRFPCHTSPQQGPHRAPPRAAGDRGLHLLGLALLPAGAWARRPPWLASGSLAEPPRAPGH